PRRRCRPHDRGHPGCARPLPAPGDGRGGRAGVALRRTGAPQRAVAAGRRRRRRAGRAAARRGRRRRAGGRVRRRGHSRARAGLPRPAPGDPRRRRRRRVSCALPPTFRLLDGWTGWDPDPALGPDAWLGLAGLGEGGALEPARVGGGVAPQALLGSLPPPPLARGCGPCEWYLVTPAPAARVLRRDGCHGFLPVRGAAGAFGTLVAPVAIAVRRHRFAVADPGTGIVRVWARSGAVNAATIPLARARGVRPAPGGAPPGGGAGGGGALPCGRPGAPGGGWPAPPPPLPPGGAVDRLAAGSDCAVWLVTRAPAVALDGSVTTAYHL